MINKQLQLHHTQPKLKV